MEKQPAHPEAPAPPAHSILVMVRRFGQWAMELGYQHIQKLPGGMVLSHLLRDGWGCGQWRMEKNLLHKQPRSSCQLKGPSRLGFCSFSRNGVNQGTRKYVE